MRTFAYQVYDTNGATPKQNAINQVNARNIAQNNLAKKGGSTTVPQFGSAKNSLSPNNPNTNIARAASSQLRMDSAAKAQANTGQKIGGRKYKTKTKTKTKRKTNRKSRKY
jgi:hypothetical protein